MTDKSIIESIYNILSEICKPILLLILSVAIFIIITYSNQPIINKILISVVGLTLVTLYWYLIKNFKGIQNATEK